MDKRRFYRKAQPPRYTDEQAVALFRGKDLYDSHRWKRYSLDQVKSWLDEFLPFRVRPVKAMMEHQLRCFALGLIHEKFYFQLDMGTGKTKLSLDLFQFRKRMEHADRALVLVPYRLNLQAWAEQCAEHAPGCSVLVCGKGLAKFLGEEDAKQPDICVMTYASFLLAMRERSANAWVKKFQFFVLDESSVLRNHGGKMFSVIRSVVDKIRFIYLLSGTPFSKDPQGLWSQFYLLDKGELLGKNITAFREAFFVEKVKSFRTVWVPIAARMDLLNKVLRHRSIRYALDECKDLPPVLRRTVSMPMTKEQTDVLRDIQERAELCLSMDQPIAWVSHELRCLSSGFRVLESGAPVPLASNPKMEALLDLLSEVEEVMEGHEGVVVVHHYLVTGDKICESLRKEKIKFVQVNGEVSGTKKDKAIKDFQEGRAKVLVANSAAAYGLNLQHASRIMIFYETSDNSEHREQMERRILRIGQDKKLYYFDLVVEGTSDDKVLSSLQSKKNLRLRVVDGRAAERSGRRRIKRET